MSAGEGVSAGEDGRTEEFPLRARWRDLAYDWAIRRRPGDQVERTGTWVRLDVPGGGTTVTVRFTTTTRLLVAFMTHGRLLSGDQLATAAAAAAAWNSKHLFPMLSLWDVRGREPRVAGVCVVPLMCRMTVGEFDVLADEWVAAGHDMFRQCAAFSL